MKRLVMVALFLFVASVPAYATTIDCYSFPDNDPVWDWFTAYCVLSPGGFCWSCVDVQRGTGCADDNLCDPNSMKPRRPIVRLGQLSPAHRTGGVQVAVTRRGRPSRSGHSDSIRPLSMRVARLNAGSLL